MLRHISNACLFEVYEQCNVRGRGIGPVPSEYLVEEEADIPLQIFRDTE